MTNRNVDVAIDIVALTTTPVQVIDQNTKRGILILQNPSASVDVRINVEDSDTDYIVIPPLQGIKFDIVPINPIWAWMASGTGNIHVMEG